MDDMKLPWEKNELPKNFSIWVEDNIKYDIWWEYIKPLSEEDSSFFQTYIINDFPEFAIEMKWEDSLNWKNHVFFEVVESVIYNIVLRWDFDAFIKLYPYIKDINMYIKWSSICYLCLWIKDDIVKKKMFRLLLDNVDTDFNKKNLDQDINCVLWLAQFLELELYEWLLLDKNHWKKVNFWITDQYRNNVLMILIENFKKKLKPKGILSKIFSKKDEKEEQLVHKYFAIINYIVDNYEINYAHRNKFNQDIINFIDAFGINDKKYAKIYEKIRLKQKEFMKN